MLKRINSSNRGGQSMRSRQNQNLHDLDDKSAKTVTGYFSDKRALDATIRGMMRRSSELETDNRFDDGFFEYLHAKTQILSSFSWRTVNWGLIAAGFISLTLWWAIFVFVLPALNVSLHFLVRNLVS